MEEQPVTIQATELILGVLRVLEDQMEAGWKGLPISEPSPVESLAFIIALSICSCVMPESRSNSSIAI